MKDIYEALKNSDIKIRFSWLPKRGKGEIEEKDDSQVITVNIYDEIVATVVHEILHYLYPKLPEREVLKEEERICKNLTKRQKKYILKLVCRKIAPIIAC